jgi:hypothetical protein
MKTEGARRGERGARPKVPVDMLNFGFQTKIRNFNIMFDARYGSCRLYGHARWRAKLWKQIESNS